MIHSEWDGIRPKVNHLPFIRHLEKLEKQLEQTQKRNFKNTGKIIYIEKLLQTKITDGKKRIFALVFCPYLVNVKKLSLEQCEKIITDYFGNSISKSTINYKLNEVYQKGILPYSLYNMKINDSQLYQIILDSGALN